MMKRLTYFLVVLVFCLSCKREKPLQFIDGYNYSNNGYHYKLLAYTEGSQKPKNGEVVWLDAVFKNQNDSVFWDSKHDMGGKFFKAMNSGKVSPAFMKHIYNMSEGDSMEFFLRAKDFFKNYFLSDSIPFFSKNDSMVKADIKLVKILDKDEFNAVALSFENQEQQEIQAFLRKNNMNISDSSGVYWLERNWEGDTTRVRVGKTAVFEYKGYFLDGKMIDYSNGNFAFVYGTPDQLLKGLNSVIGRMKKGEFVKIILSSWLAFGQAGSSNGTIPPFTPLLYEIKLIEVK